MSNRSTFSSGSSHKSGLYAESASYIPVFWLALTCDVGNATSGYLSTTRADVLSRSSQLISYLHSIFPARTYAQQTMESFVDRLAGLRTKNVKIDFQDWTEYDDTQDDFFAVQELVKNRATEFSFQQPPRQGINPADGEPIEIKGLSINSPHEMILRACSITTRQFSKASAEELPELFVGYVFD